MQKSSMPKLRSRIFDIAWVIFLGTQFVATTSWYALSDLPVKVTIYKAASIISCLLCVVAIVIGIICKDYGKKALISIAVLAVIFALSWYFARNNMLIWTLLIFAAAYGQDGRRIVRISACITAAALVITIALSQILPSADFILEEQGRVRQFLGYSWVTNSPSIFFFFSD